MRLEGNYTFDAPRELVWETFLDPVVLARIMPGCESLERTGDNEYAGKLSIKVGPVQGNFKGQVQLLDLVEPESYNMKVNGSGPAGFVNGVGEVRLEQTEAGTVMHYAGDVQVSGRIAQVGQRLMTSSARAITDQSLEALDQQIQARKRGVPAGEEAATETAGESMAPATPAPEGPSQTEFAIGVARRMVEDAIPEDQRDLVYGVAAVVAILLVLRLLAGWWADMVARRVAKRLAK